MHVIIPARYASTRLPGKPLADIGGKPLIQHVYERALEANASSVVVATDDDRIRRAAETLVRQVAQTLESHADAVMATACHRISDSAEFLNPNVVKVVFDENGYALYFSRAPIPSPREKIIENTNDAVSAYRHIGLYSYRAGFVRRYAAWPACALEKTEQLEQLRVLWHGQRIAVAVTNDLPGPGVDTPEDLERVRQIFTRMR